VVPVETAFTNRFGGVSVPPYDELNLGYHVGDDPQAVAENRRRAQDGAVAWMEQEHSPTVTVLVEPPTRPVPGTDALVTAGSELWLAVLVADCAPVLLADADAGVVAAIHCGRLGLIRGVLPNAVTAMTDLGAQPSRLQGLIGPCICGGCYELPGTLVREVEMVTADARGTTRRAKPAVDLRAGILAQLADLGVRRSGIEVSTRCTAEDPALFSHRRDGTTGRFAGFIRRR
jgi:YfiH family protein